MILIQEIQTRCKNLLSEGKTLEAVNLLEDFITKNKPEFQNEILTIKNRLLTVTKGKRLNIISFEVALVEDSKLTHNILGLIDELNNNYPQTKLLNNWIYFLKVFWGLIRKLLSTVLIGVAIILFYFRKDILLRLISGKSNVPFEELFFPTLVLILGLIIIFHKK